MLQDPQDLDLELKKLLKSKFIFLPFPPISFCQITPDYKLRIPKLPAPGPEVKPKQEISNEEPTMENAKQLSARSLCLPACRISESVQQLMDLAINTLCEAIGSSTYWCVTVLRNLNYAVDSVILHFNVCYGCISVLLYSALQLFFTVRNIFQLFYDVVPTYHK